MPNANAEKRSCGPCTACCKPWIVPEAGKFDANWCQYRVAGKGCSLYVDRPEECRLFECLWKQGQGDVNDRPDKLGVILVGTEHAIGLRTFSVLVMWEMEEGAFLKPRAQQIVNYTLGLSNMVVIRMRSIPSGYEHEYLSAPNALTAHEWSALRTFFS